MADFIREELTDLLRHKMRDPRVSASDVVIADVRVSRDLAYADVYMACNTASKETSEEEFLSVMRNAAGFFRSELAQRHSMRTTPELRFHVDRTEAEANRVEELLARVRRS